jgi:hypothetical protein
MTVLLLQIKKIQDHRTLLVGLFNAYSPAQMMISYALMQCEYFVNNHYERKCYIYISLGYNIAILDFEK